MKAKETAEKLVDKYKKTNLMGVSLLTTEAKQCALIAVDEMIKQQEDQKRSGKWSCVWYRQEVRNEIEKL